MGPKAAELRCDTDPYYSSREGNGAGAPAVAKGFIIPILILHDLPKL